MLCIDKPMMKLKKSSAHVQRAGEAESLAGSGRKHWTSEGRGKAGRRVVLDDDRALGGGIRQIFCQAAVDAANKVVPQI